MKILIIQKKFMGDVLVTSTILPLLKKKYPQSEISFLLDEKHSQILVGNPFIDHFLFFHEDGILKTLSQVKSKKFDLVIDLYSKIETGMITLFSGAKTRIGFFKNYTQIFYNKPVKREMRVKSVNTTLGIEHRLQMLEPLNIPFEETFPKVYLLNEEIENAKKILAENNLSVNDQLIMISTFGSSEEKTYPVEYMAELLQFIADHKPEAKILCNYMPAQKEKFLNLYNSLPEKTQKNIIKTFNTKNLREFTAVTSLCKCLIGNEGGATNISKALNVPTFTIFSPQIKLSDWAWTSNPKMDKFLHVTDYVPNSTDYSDFKPSLLEKNLKEFLDKTLLN